MAACTGPRTVCSYGKVDKCTANVNCAVATVMWAGSSKDEVQINYDKFAVGSWCVSKQCQEMSSGYCGARPPREGTLQMPSYSKDRARAANN